ncbi:MAG: GNAT family N-acetyltransferase, partial [Burkholderiales bacterium]
WQRRGLGRRMMMVLIEVARRRGLEAMVGHVLSSNRSMLDLCQELGFVVSESNEDPQVKRVKQALKGG